MFETGNTQDTEELMALREQRPSRRVPPLPQHERLSWDMYFSGLVAFQLHPGNKQDPATIDVRPYARLADRMIEERRKRYGY